jgi:hypothetical protein
MSDPILRNAAADAAAASLEGAFYSIHDGDTNADEVSNERLAPDYNTASGGVAALNATLSFTGAGSATASHLGVWTTGTVGTGTFRFAVELSGDPTFNAAGEIDLTAAPITVT